MSGAHLPETASLRLEVARVLQNSQNGVRHPALQCKTGYFFYRMTKAERIWKSVRFFLLFYHVTIRKIHPPKKFLLSHSSGLWTLSHTPELKVTAHAHQLILT